MGDDSSSPNGGADSNADDRRIRFGTFEVDLSAGELRKSGVKIKLHGQPFEVLAMLLERPGEVVTREELQQKLWASDTFVGFEQGLNKAINKVREALSDDASSPRYIETLPRRGYRFIAPIAIPGPVEATPTVPEKEPSPQKTTRRKKRKWWAVGFGIAALGVSSVVGFNWIEYSTRPPRVVSYRQLTTFQGRKGKGPCELDSPLVTDGPRVFFAEPNSPVSQVSISGGDVVRIPTPFPCFAFFDMSPDKTELLGVSKSDSGPFDGSLWSLSIATGQARRLGNLSGHAGAWSPDGQRIACARGGDQFGPNEVYIASRDGSDARKLVKFERGFVSSIRWSPEADLLRMIVSEDGGPASLWEVSANGDNPHRIRLFPGDTDQVYDESWFPDGKYFVFTRQRESLNAADIWVRRELKQGFFRAAAKPLQLTAGAMSFWSPAPSPDGKQILAFGGLQRGELVRYDLKLQRLEPFLSGISADHVDFSRDGEWVAYTTFPEGKLWRSRVDGSDRMQLTSSPLVAVEPRWSPDGKRIAFAGILPRGRLKICFISAEGGKLNVVAEDQNNDVVDPSWGPDGNSLIFGGSGGSPASKISFVDLRTGAVSVIPGSQGFFSPRMSPDGRFILAQEVGGTKLLSFDLQTQKWSDLLEGRTDGAGWPQWTSDSKRVYFDSSPPGTKVHSLFCVGIADHKLERVATVAVPEGTTGMWGGGWFGITPDGSPLLLRDRSIQEIYALDVDLP
jgi:Tol biopolymer transport system component/DNA-binding winged helix-turn-helix (wHTH) protein